MPLLFFLTTLILLAGAARASDVLEPDKMVTSEVAPGPVLDDHGNWSADKHLHQVRVATDLSRHRIYEILFEKLAR